MAATIRYRGAGEALFGRRDVFAPEIFSVHGDGYDLTFLAVASGTLGEILRHQRLDQSEVVRWAGLIELERRLLADELAHRPEEGYEELLFTSDHLEELLAAYGSAKRCAWQVRGRRGLECDATLAGEERSTTEAACRACALPDSRVICAHLRHPTNLPVRTFGAFERLAGPALCDIGKNAEDGSDCRPGGKECWQRIFDPTSTAEQDTVAAGAAGTSAFAGDLFGEVAAAIDNFDRAYRIRYGAGVWNIDQARTIAELGGPANSEAQFQRKVQVLGILLDGLRPYDQLDEAQRDDTAGKRIGGLVALERLLERDAPQAVGPARTLRHIRTLRNDFPAHVRARGFEQAVHGLGLTYPPEDWDAAWRLLLTRFRDSLDEIRLALASG